MYRSARKVPKVKAASVYFIFNSIDAHYSNPSVGLREENSNKDARNSNKNKRIETLVHSSNGSSIPLNFFGQHLENSKEIVFRSIN